MFAGARAAHTAGNGACTPGALSAVGIFLADAVRDFSRTVMLRLACGSGRLFDELEERGRAEFAQKAGGIFFAIGGPSLPGQGYEFNVPFVRSVVDAFHDYCIR